MRVLSIEWSRFGIKLNARDNWHGPWPPQFAALDGGQPLAEARRPREADAG